MPPKRKCNLAQCRFLSVNNFRKILKYFHSPAHTLEVLDLNLLGAYKQQRFTLKSLKVASFQALKEFHALSINMAVQDIVDIVTDTNMHTISFTIQQKNREEKCNFECFSKIERILVEFKTNSVESEVFLALMNSLVNVLSLELYWSSRNGQKYLFDFRKFRNKFTKLRELTLQTSIYLMLVSYGLTFVNNLDRFNVNIDLEAESNDLLSSLIQKTAAVNMRVKRRFVDGSNYVFLNEIDSFLIEPKIRDAFYEKLHKIEFLKDIGLSGGQLTSTSFSNLSMARHLSVLDIRRVHLHSSESVCQILATLDCKLNFVLFFFSLLMSNLIIFCR